MTLDEIKNDFEKLLNCKSLGFYNCVEKITIFLINKKSNSTENYFTIFVFDEQINPTYSKTNLTSELIPISDTISIGIIREIISIETAIKCFNALCENIGNGVVDIGQGQLAKGICELVPKVFVPKNSTQSPQLNKVLKNNYFNGSYIIEFFDVEKNCLSSLNANQIEKANEAIYHIIPIDLFAVSDRIGNFIFQFPSINLKHHYKGNQNRKLDFSIHTDSRLSPNINYQLICESVYDGNVIGYGIEQISSVDNSFEIALGEHNSKWAKISWSVLQELETKELIEYSENISLTTCYLNTTGDLLEDGFHSIDVTKKNQIISTIAQTIYKRWEEALITSKRNSRFQNNILISNYISILLPSMDFLFSDSKLWIEQFQKYVSLLDSDSHKWYSSETNHSSSFFVNLSNIYYLVVIRKDMHELLEYEDVRASAVMIKFLLSKFEGFWKFNDSATSVNQIKDLLGI